MDLTYYKKMEPFWGVWYIDKELGAGSYGHVFRIKREDFGETYYAALKIISIPNDDKEIGSLKSEGMDERSISIYYDSFASELVKEFSLMAKIKGQSNIVSYEDHMTIRREDGIGYDILIRMELLTPLNEYTDNNTVTEKMVAGLGIDICRALEVCGQYNIIHRDIKPENVFVSQLGNFKLGDFGVSRVASQSTQGMSVKGTISYMAPEVYKGQQYNATVDYYSLGIMMYKLINNNRGPFLPPAPEIMRFADRENADNLRMSGAEFPNAANAGPELMRIIRKATAYDYKERYTNASKMRMDLERFVIGLGDNTDSNKSSGTFENYEPSYKEVGTNETVSVFSSLKDNSSGAGASSEAKPSESQVNFVMVDYEQQVSKTNDSWADNSYRQASAETSNDRAGTANTGFTVNMGNTVDSTVNNSTTVTATGTENSGFSVNMNPTKVKTTRGKIGKIVGYVVWGWLVLGAIIGMVAWALGL